MSKTIQFTITHNEHLALELIAKSMGFDTIGKYAKFLLFHKANSRNVKGIMAQLNGLAKLENVFELAQNLETEEYHVKQE